MNNIQHNPNILVRLAAVGAAVGLSVGAVACSEDDAQTKPRVSYDTRQDSSDTSPDGSSPENGVTTTSPESVKDMTDEQKKAYDELVAAGFDPEETASFILLTSVDSLQDPTSCIDRVEEAKGGRASAFRQEWLVKTAEDGETVINRDMFATTTEGIVENGGPNLFTDSVSEDYMAGTQTTPEEVASYFGDTSAAAERELEANQEAYARLCGDSYELSSMLVVLANAKMGNTNVRIGDLNPELMGDLLVGYDRSPEEMTEAIETAINRYVVEYPVGVDTQEEREEFVNGLDAEERAKYIDAYNRQLEDAARLVVLLQNFGGVINNEEVQVNGSVVALPALTEAGYPKLAFSSQDVLGTEDQALGGKYSAMAGSLLTFFSDAKGGCITIEGVSLNVLDGRAGYVSVEIEGCEPVVITVPPTTPENSNPTTTQRREVAVPTNSSVIAGPGAGGEPDEDDNPDNNITTSLVEQPTTTQDVPETTITVAGDDEDNGYVPIP